MQLGVEDKTQLVGKKNVGGRTTHRLNFARVARIHPLIKFYFLNFR
jgi:hypothetical protein